jgi:hypothetical protein
VFVTLQSGLNRLEFVSDTPAQTTGSDPRPLSLNVRNLRIELQREISRERGQVPVFSRPT